MPAPFHPRDDTWGQMPWWVRAIAVLGVPGVLTMYLVYTGVQELPAIRRTAELNTQEILSTRDILRDHLRSQEATYRLLQRICSQTAKSDVDRANCFY